MGYVTPDKTDEWRKNGFYSHPEMGKAVEDVKKYLTTSQEQSLESVIGRPIKTAQGLNPLVLNRFNLYSRARQNGFDSKGAVDAAMSTAGTIEPGKPEGVFQKLRSKFDQTETGKTVESNLSQLSRMFRNANEKLSNPVGMSLASPDILAKVAAKAFRNGALNPNAWRRLPLTEQEIAAAPMLSHPLTQYMFCNPAEGGVALVLCRADQASRYTARPVYLRAVSFRTRRFGSFEVFSPWLSPARAPGPTAEAAAEAFEQAGIGPEDVDLAQLQDTESGAEIMHMAETGSARTATRST